MSWPWAKRHPMPEPAEFIRQNTTALNPDMIRYTEPRTGLLSEIAERVRIARCRNGIV